MKDKEYGPFILRIALGFLFLVAASGKLLTLSAFIATLTKLGLPMPTAFAWLLIIVEIPCAIALLVGWKTEIVVWPLAVDLFGAIIFTQLGMLSDAHARNGAAFHLLGLLALVALSFMGPGKFSLSGKK